LAFAVHAKPLASGLAQAPFVQIPVEHWLPLVHPDPVLALHEPAPSQPPGVREIITLS
jgi:hypothetical protein